MPSVKQKEIRYRALKWFAIQNPSKKVMLDLEKDFDFHPLDLEECTTKTHRSKIEMRDTYIYIVILVPRFPNGAEELETSEVNVFLRKNTVIAITEGSTPALDDFWHTVEKYPKTRPRYMKSPEWLMYYIIKRILEYRIPILEKIDEEIDSLERQIFKSENIRSLLKEISIVRRNIIDYRKITQPHRSVIEKVEAALIKSNAFKMTQADAYYDDLVAEAKEAWDQLENFKERIEALQETNESLTSFKINDTIRTLTIFSMLLLPMSVIASVFGMNSKNLPIIGQVFDFWIVLGIMAAVSLCFFIYFRIRRWL